VYNAAYLGWQSGNPANFKTGLWNLQVSYVMTSRAQTPSVIADEEIVRQFQETGDGECFAELFARHRKKVYFACRAFYSDGGAGEDATQETFLRAYEKIHQFSGGDFCGWLMRIARNVCIDQWRKRRPEVEIDNADLSEAHAEPITVPAYDLRLTIDRVWQEMRSLAPEQQRCLEMKIEGYSYDETATRTGLSVEAVKSHLQNGRRMLWLKVEGMLSQSK
jgi:RNA polymerase sigma-70 factor, ECF subfamily